ncbi:hypothetical protein ACQKQA_00770 [Pseudomonas sp. NPDC089530]|uniref:hypothetical protein n=1 Tax=Pseudomonas sp. NPDC089530 TaxID=3390651 RepID=UPI003D0033B0
MNRTFQSLILVSCLALTQGCTALEKSNSFTLTADLPPEFTYEATAAYVPAKGETCTVPGGRNTKIGYNSDREKYKPDSEILLRRTVSGCPLVLHSVDFYVYGWYGKDRGDFGRDSAMIAIREELPEARKGTFNAAGQSEFAGQCQFLFRTVGGLRRIVKILDCKRMDESGVQPKAKPFVAYSLDQLPGKTVRLKIKLADDEQPYYGRSWLKLSSGWKPCIETKETIRCQSPPTFTDFRMPDGRICTIYPGCTENKEVTP